MRTFVALLLMIPAMAFAQDRNSIVIYSEEPLDFQVYLSDALQNEAPVSYLVINDVPKEALAGGIRIDFVDERMANIEARPVFTAGMALTYLISREGDRMKIEQTGEVEDRVFEGVPGLVTTYRGGTDAIDAKPPVPVQPVILDLEPVSPEGSTDQVGDYEGPTGCASPDDPAEVTKIVSTLKRAPNDEARSDMLVGLITGKCMTTAQQKEILLCFGSADARLGAAKKLYPSLWDRANVSVFQDALGSQANWDAYLRFINYYSE